MVPAAGGCVKLGVEKQRVMRCSQGILERILVILLYGSNTNLLASRGMIDVKAARAPVGIDNFWSPWYRP